MQQALKQKGMQNSTEKEIARLKQQFLQSADFISCVYIFCHAQITFDEFTATIPRD